MMEKIKHIYVAILYVVALVVAIVTVAGMLAVCFVEKRETVVVQPGCECDCARVQQDYCGVEESVDAELAAEMAKLVWGEARGCSTMEQAAVLWCVFNRVDSPLAYFPDDALSVIRQKNAFSGYNPNNPATPELIDLAIDVMTRWKDEKAGCEEVGRVLPAEYLYFHGDGTHNYFRTEYNGGFQWDFSFCENPYSDSPVV